MDKRTGRPSDYRPHFAEQVQKLAKLGATDKDLADFFEVSEQTLNSWKQKHPEFLDSLKQGKALADAEVASKLFHRAVGYQHPDTDIRVINGEIVMTPITKHYAPDTTACIFWLKNRRKDLWRDKTDHEVAGKDGGPIEVSEASDMEVARRLAFVLARGAIEKARET